MLLWQRGGSQRLMQNLCQGSLAFCFHTQCLCLCAAFPTGAHFKGGRDKMEQVDQLVVPSTISPDWFRPHSRALRFLGPSGNAPLDCPEAF